VHYCGFSTKFFFLDKDELHNHTLATIAMETVSRVLNILSNPMQQLLQITNKQLMLQCNTNLGQD